jgi:hypothetical protein
MGSSERMILLHYDHVLFDLRSGGLTGSDQADGAWLRQTGILQETVELIENDPDDHLSEEDQGTANE